MDKRQVLEKVLEDLLREHREARLGDLVRPKTPPKAPEPRGD